MELHLEEESVQLYACTAITNMCHNSTDNRGRFYIYTNIVACTYDIKYIHTTGL